MEFILVAVLAVTLILLAAQAVLMFKERRKYNESIAQVHNLERALRISKGQLIDSERERKWLGNQILIILDDQKRAAPVGGPGLNETYSYAGLLKQAPKEVADVLSTIGEIVHQ